MGIIETIDYLVYLHNILRILTRNVHVMVGRTFNRMNMWEECVYRCNSQFIEVYIVLEYIYII